MKFYNVGFGGTNSTDAVYLTNNGYLLDIQMIILNNLFIMSFRVFCSGIFLHSLIRLRGKMRMDPALTIMIRKAGVGAIRNNQSSQQLDTVLCQRVFLHNMLYRVWKMM